MLKDIDKLIKDHKRLIEAEASKYAKFVPLTYVQIEAYKLAHKAAQSYDPSMNIRFSTYLTNMLQKLSRLSTQYGSSVRVPENKQFKINRLNQIEQGLAEELGRAPTTTELSDTLGSTVRETNNLLQARKKDVSLSNLSFSPVFNEGSANDDWVHFVYHDLSDKDKLIFEHVTGFGGKAKLDNNTIAKKFNISPSTVSQRIKMIKQKITEGMNS